VRTVLDAGAVVELLLGTARGEAIYAHIKSSVTAAPHLIRVEVLQALRKGLALGRLGAARASEAVADLEGLNLRLYPHEPLVQRVWALRANASAYDAAYLALAEALEAPLVTVDAGLRRVPGSGAEVRVF